MPKWRCRPGSNLPQYRTWIHENGGYFGARLNFPSNLPLCTLQLLSRLLSYFISQSTLPTVSKINNISGLQKIKQNDVHRDNACKARSWIDRHGWIIAEITDNSDMVMFEWNLKLSFRVIFKRENVVTKFSVHGGETARESFLGVTIILCGNCNRLDWRKIGLRTIPDLIQDNFGRPWRLISNYDRLQTQIKSEGKS